MNKSEVNEQLVKKFVIFFLILLTIVVQLCLRNWFCTNNIVYLICNTYFQCDLLYKFILITK